MSSRDSERIWLSPGPREDPGDPLPNPSSSPSVASTRRSRRSDLQRDVEDARRALAMAEKKLREAPSSSASSTSSRSREVERWLRDTIDAVETPPQSMAPDHMASAPENGRQTAPPHATMPPAWESLRTAMEDERVRGASAENARTAARLRAIDDRFDRLMLSHSMSAIRRTEEQRQAAKHQLLHSTRVPETSRHAERTTVADAILLDEMRRMEERNHWEKQHGERRQTAANNGWSNADRSFGGLGTTRNYTSAYPLLNQSQISARQCTSKELPTFSGDPREWSVFISNFEYSTAICGFSNEENLLRLQRCLKGKARDAVSSCLAHPATVPEAIDILTECYGRPELVVDTLMAKIRRMPAPKEHSFESLVEFGLAVRNLCAAIGASGLHDYFNGGSLLNELVEKLPPNTRLNWFYHRRRQSASTLEAFNGYMKELTSAACLGVKPQVKDERPHHQHHGEARGRSERTGGTRYATLNVHASNEHHDAPRTDPTGKRCPACHEACASLDVCKKFGEMGVAARWQLLKGAQGHVCRMCLRSHSSPCRVGKRCTKENCGRKHHILLHDDDYWKQNAVSTNAVKTAECLTHRTQPNGALLKYLPVTLHANDRRVNTMALLDDGSTATFIEHALLEELGTSGKQRPLCVTWTGKQQRYERDSVELPLQISGQYHDAKIFKMPSVHTLEEIKIHPQSIHPEELARRYTHLRGLPITRYDNAEIRVIIGVDNRHLTDALRTVEGDVGEPAAAKTRLGWVVYGPCEKQHASGDIAEHAKTSLNLHLCSCNERDDSVHEAMKQYFSIDSLGVGGTGPTTKSAEEERALKILKSVVHQREGHFEAGLLWKTDDITLPDSRAMALKRYHCLQKKLQRDPKLETAMREKMEEYERKGYTRKLTAAEIAESHPTDWYLPIFPVTNPNKPGKVRVVFDAAAKANGVSLNSHLLTGPDQLVDLLTVLFKFRENKIAVTGDIREMFFQVKMNPRDQRSQMFFWNSGKGDDTPQPHILTVMTFGAACSPSTAHYVKNTNADSFQDQHPRAVEAIKYEHYVDDMLSSVESEAEAIKLAEEVRHIHSVAGFEIRNWLSNSPKVKMHLNGEAVGNKELLSNAVLTTEKVLGMWWNTKSDTFTFRLNPRRNPQTVSPTKRTILGVLMSIYDPMGLIGNLLMFLKVLIQEIWRSKCTWDEEISGRLREKWSTWVAVLPRVEQISIPRWYRRRATSQESTYVTLHIFCDASENGTATVAYLRFEENGEIECALVGSKTRVAPLAFTSIPRLELEAAVLGARLAKTIEKSHRLRISRKVFWTDSRTVISWLNSDHRRYSQFVAHRVSQIVTATNVSEWNWLPTKLNVADEGTKWTTPPELHPDARWFRGPQFLWEPESSWPIKSAAPCETEEEIRHTLLQHATTSPTFDVTRFSRWNRLVRTAAYVHRFIKRPRTKGTLTADELQAGENAIFRQIQREVYREEIHQLEKGTPDTVHTWKQPLRKCSPLYKLSPVLDGNGVLRMRGRIERCTWVGDDMKRPIIIPRQHYVARLILQHYHQRYRHANHDTAMNEIRAKYQIPQLRAAYKETKRRCQHCKIYGATPQPPAMGDLPPQRLAAFQRPYSYTGIDYFGPMTVAVGRRVEKRWGVIFTCLTTRGVHLELTYSLTTGSCILAMRSFIARRGVPLEVISDRGTNFVGAAREVRDALKDLDESRLAEELAEYKMKWSFNPPAAPHFGGAWERLIQSVKKILATFNLPPHPTDELLRARLMDVELIVNSRPLTELPMDDITEGPLTPNHFTLGSSNGHKPLVPFDDSPPAAQRAWRSSIEFADLFWRRWVEEYLPTLTRRSKWHQQADPVQEGDLVLIVDPNSSRNDWPRGRVLKVIRAADGQVRRATVNTSRGLLERPVVKLAVLDVGERELG